METERHDYFNKRKITAAGTLVKNTTVDGALKLKKAISEHIPFVMEKVLQLFKKPVKLNDFHKLYQHGLFPENLKLEISKWQNEDFLDE